MPGVALNFHGVATKELLACPSAALGTSDTTCEVRLWRRRPGSHRCLRSILSRHAESARCRCLVSQRQQRLDSGRSVAEQEVQAEPGVHGGRSRPTSATEGPKIPRRLALLLGSSLIGQLDCAEAAKAAGAAEAAVSLVAYSPSFGGWGLSRSHAVSLETDVSAQGVLEDAFLRRLREDVRSALGKSRAAGALRLPFHDAFTFDPQTGTGGMNGSIILELDRPENFGLKRIIRALAPVKEAYDKTNPVSWADLIAIGGAEAVGLCKGPFIPVELGRIDAREPDVEGQLPPETASSEQLKSSFRAKTFSVQELVALCGAHTVGSKGFGDPTTFDNTYFRMLLERPWDNKANEMASMIGLPTDRAIAVDDECLEWVRLYAKDQGKFFVDFRDAYVKLVNLGVKRNPIIQQSA